ncbi:retrovirus-related Pol polyprotein from transposon 297 [Trichonephila clavipes]|nr:retrovirus-related Pol polyprotein from transposon 297 [Trichonephila clavipes]
MSSKYPDAVPMPDIASTTVVEALFQIFSRMGFPKEIFKRTRELHSREKQLPAALFALRTITHESTGFTPAELVHGKNLRTPITLLYENWIGTTEEVTPVVEYVFQLINRLKSCQELVIEKMEETKIKRKAWLLADSLNSKAQRLAAFTISFGTYRPLRMPFELKNAPYYFSRLMAELLQGSEIYILSSRHPLQKIRVAVVAEWYRHRIVAGFVTSSSPVPLKTRRVGQRCTLNLSRAEMSSRWCGVVVRRGGCQLRCRPRHLTMVQNYVVRRQKPSCS